MRTGYGLKYNKTLSIDALKSFGEGQSLNQDRPNQMPSPDGDWNDAYTPDLKQGGFPPSSVQPRGGK